MADVYLVDGVRTPVGRLGGALAEVRPDDLAATVVRSVVERTGIDGSAIDDVILGAANQAGEGNRNDSVTSRPLNGGGASLQPEQGANFRRNPASSRTSATVPPLLTEATRNRPMPSSRGDRVLIPHDCWHGRSRQLEDQCQQHPFCCQSRSLKSQVAQ